MLDLKSCVLCCRGGIQPLDKKETETMLAQVPDWKLLDDATKIQRNYTFDNFIDAPTFTNKVAELSEAQNHHPNITLGWGVLCGRLLFS